MALDGYGGVRTGSTSGPNIDLSGLLGTLTADYQESRAAKQKRYDEGIGILEKIVNMFGPGYLKGEEKRMLAGMEQGMVGRGLGGTTRPAAVGTGIKADIRDRATKSRTTAMGDVARFMANFQDIYPQASTLAHLATGGFSGLLQQQLAQAPGGPLGPMQISSGGTGGRGGSLGGLSYSSGGTGGGTGRGGASATVGFGPSGGGALATGAGAAMYGMGGGYGDYVPQAGDYMSVEGGPGGPILPGGGSTSYGEFTDPEETGGYEGRRFADTTGGVRGAYIGYIPQFA